MYTYNIDSKSMESVKEHELAKWSGTRLKDCITTLERYGIEATIMEGGSILHGKWREYEGKESVWPDTEDSKSK